MASQVVLPRGRGFIMVNAHPMGCQAEVATQWRMAHRARLAERGGTALVIGASTGYGLASRATAAASAMKTVGVMLERPAERQRTASAGWYNTAAFHQLAGEGHWSVNADAFADATKCKVAEILQASRPAVELVIYSLAAPVRAHPGTGERLRSVLKPVGAPYAARSLDLDTQGVVDVVVDPASDEEIASTVAVMGGDDLRRWVRWLADAKLLHEGAVVVAYSYIGPRVTWPIYRDGTVGAAKQDLEQMVSALDEELKQQVGGRAVVSVNKAVVTQASAAIPAVPLYISLLYKLMKAAGTHEGPIEQMSRLFRCDFGALAGPLDDKGRVRLDDLELDPRLQQEIEELWPTVTTENLFATTDFAGYRSEFLRLFGFEVPGVDYERPTETDIPTTDLLDMTN